MKRYLVAGTTYKERFEGNVRNYDWDIQAFIVLATTWEEAYGKALLVMQKLRPGPDGWQKHFCKVIEDTPERVITNVAEAKLL